MLHSLPFLSPSIRWKLANRFAWRRYTKDAGQDHKRARKQFVSRHGYALNLAHPVTHSERTYLRKLGDQDPRFVRLCDKRACRDYIDEVAGTGTSDDLCVPIIAQSTRFETLPASLWQQDVILKCTHGSGMNCIVKAGDTKARQIAAKRIRKWLGRVHGASRFEWAYFDLEPTVIAEPLLEGGHVLDIKLYFYAGTLGFIMTEDNCAKQPAIRIYRPDWSDDNTTFDQFALADPMPRPAFLDEMIAVATPLSAGFDMIRIDFVVTTTRFYLGEITVYDGSGLAKFDTYDHDQAFARFWTQPHLGIDCNDG